MPTTASPDIFDDVAGTPSASSTDIFDQVSGGEPEKPKTYLPEVNKAVASVPKPDSPLNYAVPGNDVTGAVTGFFPEKAPRNGPRGQLPATPPLEAVKATLEATPPQSETPLLPGASTEVSAAQHLATPGKRWQGATEAVQGAGEAVTPFMGPAATEMAAVPELAPALKFATGLGVGIGGQPLAEKGAEKLGASPEQQQFWGELAFWAPQIAGLLASQVKGGVDVTPGGTRASISTPGGKVGAGVAVTPEGVTVRGKVGPLEGSKTFQRGGGQQPGQIEAPTIEGQPPAAPGPPPPSDDPAITSMANAHQAQTTAAKQAAGIPEPPPPTILDQPNAPPELKENRIAPESITRMASFVAGLPDAQRAQAVQEAHQTLTAALTEMGKRGPVSMPDGTLALVKDPKSAEKLAISIINDAVKAHDKVSASLSGEGERGKQTGAVSPKEAASGDIFDQAAQNPTATEKASPVGQESQQPLKKGDTATLARDIDVNGKTLAKGTKVEIQYAHPNGLLVRAVAEDGTKISRGVGAFTKGVESKGAPAAEKPASSVPVPLEQNGAEGGTLRGASQGNDEQLPSGVSEGRPSGDNKPQRAEETPKSVTPAAEPEHPNLNLGEHAAHTEMVPTKTVAEYGKDVEMLPVEELEKLATHDRRKEPFGTDMDELKADIQKNGIKEPLELGYNHAEKKAVIWDGNHRLGVAKELGLKELPVRVKATDFPTAKYGKEVAGYKGEGTVPERLKPSDIGIGARPVKTEAKQEEKPTKYKFGNTQAPIPAGSEAATALKSAQDRIAASDLTGKGKETDPHVTVRYGIKTEDTKGIREFLSKQAPFEAKLGKTDKFPPSEHSEGAAVIIAPIEAPELHRLNAELEKHGDFTEPSFKEYRPHATIAYVDPEKAGRYTGMSVTDGKKFTVDKVYITDRNGNAEAVKLEGTGTNVTERPPVAANVTKPETPAEIPGGFKKGEFVYHEGRRVRVEGDATLNVRPIWPPHSPVRNQLVGVEIRDQQGGIHVVKPSELSREPQEKTPKPVTPQIVPEKKPAPGPTLKQGDKVAWQGQRGAQLSGTVRSIDTQRGTAEIDTDQIVSLGGRIPIGRIETVKLDRLQWEESPQQQGLTSEPKIETEANEPENQPARTAGETENLPSVSEPTGEGGNARIPVPSEGSKETPAEQPTESSSGRQNPERVERPGGLQEVGDESARSGGNSPAANPSAGGEREVEKKPEPESSPEEPEKAIETVSKLRNQNNYHISDEDAAQIGFGGEITKIRGNLDALELLKKLQAEGREMATPDEQKTLAKYVDFGGLVGMLQNRHSREYGPHYERFEKILSPEEIQEIRETLPNTHYTSMQMVDAVWKGINRLGFRGGRVLEPGMGIGNFFGRMPEKASQKSDLFGVERNPLTGAMARYLYPDAKIVVRPFQQFQLPHNSLDLIVGNVPFQDVKITNDKPYSKLGLNLHNYFIVKSLDILKPGGIAALITSRYTMDNTQGSGIRAREEMAKRADLLAALRLPDKAFKGNANTEVVADLLIFRKRALNDIVDEMPDWTKTAEITVAGEEPIKKFSYGREYVTNEEHTKSKTFFINQYFIENPRNVLGAHSQEGKMYGPGQYTVKMSAEDFPSALNAAIERLPKNVYGKVKGGKAAEPAAIETQGLELAPDDVKPGAFYVDDKSNVKIKQAGAGVDIPPELRTKPIIEHIKAAIALRDQVKRTTDIQLESHDDEALEEEQGKLSKLYDAYVKKYGSAHGRELHKIFGHDPEYPRLLSLENLDTETKEISKADIFTKRVLAPYEPLRDLPSDPKAAMLKVLAARGYLDTGLMAQLLKEPEETIVKRLTDNDLIYKDPVAGSLRTTDEYLSGNVREKLRFAENAAGSDPEFKRNVEALKKAQPKPLTIHEIQPNLGATWIPVKIYRAFVANLMKVSAGSVKVTRKLDGSWLVQADQKTANSWNGGGISAHKLVEAGLNQRQPTVWERDADGKRYVNQEATTGAREKLSAIKEEFRTVLRRAPDAVVEELEQIYNDNFNGVKKREFSGDHLDFPGMSEKWRKLMRGYQKAFVWRTLQEGRGGLFHAPGLGKTLTMISSGMEARRLKLSRKNLYAVPNHMIPQWREDFKRFYPTSTVLAVQEEDLTADNRNKLMSRIATGDWDAVLIPHSQFDLLPMSPEYEKKTIDKYIADYRRILEELDSKDKDDKKTIKQIEKLIDKLESRLDALNSKKKDNTITFDKMGFDLMFVDEAHAYKAMPTPSKMGNIKGLSKRDSQKALAMEMKADFMRETHNGRGVVFGTGTPLTNTIGELYIMTKYLAPELLEEVGIKNFDDWAAQFATAVTTWEYAADGVTFRPSTSLAEYVNVPELSTMFQRFAEYLSTADAVKLTGMKLPEARRKDVTVEVTPTQEPLLEMIAARGQQLFDHPPRTKEERQADNWLKLSSDARKISLDPRLYDPDLHDDPESKVNKAVAIIKRDLEESKRILDPNGNVLVDNGTVVVFSDFFQHRDPDTEKIDFSLMEDMRRKLVKAGVPREQIAIIHEAGDSQEKKEEMFAKTRTGKIRVLFGSTDKLGIGTNVQDRLYSIVHLDQPWRPDQVEQREARGVRSGNMLSRVNIYRLISEPKPGKIKRMDPKTHEMVEKDRPRAYDLQMYQQLERKANSQEQFLSGHYSGRTMEETSGDVKLNSQMFALGKAMSTGNPDALRKLKLEHDMRTQQLLERNFQTERSKNTRDLNYKETRLAVNKEKIKLLTKYADTWKESTAGMEAERDKRLAEVRDRMMKMDRAAHDEYQKLVAEKDKRQTALKDESLPEDQQKELRKEIRGINEQIKALKASPELSALKDEYESLRDSGLPAPVQIDKTVLDTREKRVEYFEKHPDLMELVDKPITIGGVPTILRSESEKKVDKETGKYYEVTNIVYQLPTAYSGDWHQVPFDSEKQIHRPMAFLNSFQQRARALASSVYTVKSTIADDEKEIEALKEEVAHTDPYIAKIEAMEKEMREIDIRLGRVDPKITESAAEAEDESVTDAETNEEADDEEENPKGIAKRLLEEETGELNVSKLGEVVSNFYQQDVAKGLEKAGIGLREVPALFTRALYPRIEESNPIGRALGVAAPADAVDALMKVQGDRAKALAEFDLVLNGVEKMFDRLPESARIDFIDNIQTGQEQPLPELDDIAAAFKKIMDAQRAEEQEAANLGREKKAPIELSKKANYFHNWWDTRPGKEPEEEEGERISRLFTPKRPLEGTKGYNRRQSYTIKSGIEAGGEPVTTNPVRILRHRIEDGMKFVTARRAWNQTQELGLRQYVRKGAKRPAGFDKIDDKIAKVYFPAFLEFPGMEEPMQVAHEIGEWYVEANTARLLNNMLSVDKIRRNPVGRGLMWLKNASTALELGLSPFHAVFESIEAMSSMLSLGMQRAYNQGIRQGKPGELAQGIREMVSSPAAPITLAREGAALPAYIEARARLGKIGLTEFGHVISGEQPHGVLEALKQFQEVRKEKAVQRLIKQYPDLDQLVDDMFQGGLVIGQHRDYQVKALGKTAAEAFSEGNPIGAVWRAIPTLTQGVMYPLFNWYIPNLKYSLFLKMMSEAAGEHARELDSGELTRATLARRVADSVENRFGELNFDNLFLNRTTKTALQFLFRSMTYKLGTVREFSGAGGGQLRELGTWAKDAADLLGGGGGGKGGGKGTAEGSSEEEPEGGKTFGEKALPRLDSRAAWVTSLMIVTAMLGTIAAKLLTKKYPWQWIADDEKEGMSAESAMLLEVTHPRTGEFDSRGKPVRISLPTYWKDVEHAAAHPAQYVLSSLSGIVSKLIDTAENKDYFGNYVYNPSAPLGTKLKQAGKYNFPMPFVASNFLRGQAQNQTKTAWLSAFGFPKAPSDLDFTPAEKAAQKIIKEHESPATPEELEAWREKRQAFTEGKLPLSQARAFMKRARESMLQRQLKNSAVSYSDARRVYELATPEEKKSLEHIMYEKRSRLLREHRGGEVKAAESSSR